MTKACPRVGILGAGQLALMLAEAGNRLGVDVVCAGRPGDCAEQAATVVPVALDDVEAVRKFASRVDLVTIESENIDASVLAGLNLAPNARAIGIAQDRWAEKTFFHKCGLATAPFAKVDTLADLRQALRNMETATILKTRRMGYDGKGQARLRTEAETDAAWMGVGQVPCILEGMVPFDAEVSLIAARNAKGKVVFYPLAENVHSDGILRVSSAPCSHAELQGQAESYMAKLMLALNYIGVLAVEFFVLGGALIANEMAPRVHNSGHWTIEGADTSQFENFLRAILGMELGSTASRPMVMLNCIGNMPAETETQAFPMVRRHDYGKEARPGRKVGHLTIPASERATIAEWQRRLNPV